MTPDTAHLTRTGLADALASAESGYTKFVLFVHEKLEKMKHITSIEMVGQMEQAAKMLNLLLNSKFGQLPDWATAKINDASVESIEKWTEKFLRSDSIKDVFYEFNNTSVRHFRPCKEDIQLAKEIIEFEESTNKPYLSGLIWNSMQQQASKIFIILLNIKFGKIPDWAIIRISEASVESIERWAERILHINKLEDFFENNNESKHHGECVTMPVQLLTFCGMNVVDKHL